MTNPHTQGYKQIEDMKLEAAMRAGFVKGFAMMSLVACIIMVIVAFALALNEGARKSNEIAAEAELNGPRVIQSLKG